MQGRKCKNTKMETKEKKEYIKRVYDAIENLKEKKGCEISTQVKGYFLTYLSLQMIQYGPSDNEAWTKNLEKTVEKMLPNIEENYRKNKGGCEDQMFVGMNIDMQIALKEDNLGKKKDEYHELKSHIENLVGAKWPFGNRW